MSLPRFRRLVCLVPVLILLGCATVESSLKEGNIAKASELAEAQKGADREKSFLQIADAFFAKKKYPEAAANYEKAGAEGKRGLKKIGDVYLQAFDIPNAEKYLLASGMSQSEVLSTLGRAARSSGKIDLAIAFFEKAGDKAGLDQIVRDMVFRGQFDLAEPVLRKLGLSEVDIHQRLGRESMNSYPSRAIGYFEKAGNAAGIAQVAKNLEASILKNKDPASLASKRDVVMLAFIDAVNRLVRMKAVDQAPFVLARLVEWGLVKEAETVLPFLKDKRDEVGKAARAAMGQFKYRFALSLFSAIDARADFEQLASAEAKILRDLKPTTSKDAQAKSDRIYELGKACAEAGMEKPAREIADSYIANGSYGAAEEIFKLLKMEEKDYAGLFFDAAIKSKDQFYAAYYAKKVGGKKNIAAAADLMLEKENYFEALELYDEAGSAEGSAKAYAAIRASLKRFYDEPPYEPFLAELAAQEKRCVSLLLYKAGSGTALSGDRDMFILFEGWKKQYGLPFLKKLEPIYKEFSLAYGKALLGLPKNADKDAIAAALIDRSKKDLNAMIIMNLKNRTIDKGAAALSKYLASAK